MIASPPPTRCWPICSSSRPRDPRARQSGRHPAAARRRSWASNWMPVAFRAPSTTPPCSPHGSVKNLPPPIHCPRRCSTSCSDRAACGRCSMASIAWTTPVGSTLASCPVALSASVVRSGSSMRCCRRPAISPCWCCRMIQACRRCSWKLQEARARCETALAVLRAPPDGLRLFLGSAMASVHAIRATLRMPARTQEALREKLGRLRTEAAGLAAEAAAIGLSPVVAQLPVAGGLRRPPAVARQRQWRRTAAAGAARRRHRIDHRQQRAHRGTAPRSATGRIRTAAAARAPQRGVA